MPLMSQADYFAMFTNDMDLKPLMVNQLIHLPEKYAKAENAKVFI